MEKETNDIVKDSTKKKKTFYLKRNHRKNKENLNKNVSSLIEETNIQNQEEKEVIEIKNINIENKVNTEKDSISSVSEVKEKKFINKNYKKNKSYNNFNKVRNQNYYPKPNIEDVEETSEVVKIKTKQELLKELIQFQIKQKTGLKTNEVKNNLILYHQLYGNLDIQTLSGTNLIGLCVLNDNIEVLKNIKEIKTLLNEDLNISNVPYVLGQKNLSVSFSKSGELNKEILEICNNKEDKDFILGELIKYASKNLYRDENIELYLPWLISNTDEEYKTNLMINCIIDNNRNILSKAVEYKEYREIIIENKNKNPVLKIWLEQKLKVSKINNIKEKVELKTNINNRYHLSSSEDKNKVFNNLLEKTNTVIIEKKVKKNKI